MRRSGRRLKDNQAAAGCRQAWSLGSKLPAELERHNWRQPGPESGRGSGMAGAPTGADGPVASPLHDTSLISSISSRQEASLAGCGGCRGVTSGGAGEWVSRQGSMQRVGQQADQCTRAVRSATERQPSIPTTRAQGSADNIQNPQLATCPTVQQTTFARPAWGMLAELGPHLQGGREHRVGEDLQLAQRHRGHAKLGLHHLALLSDAQPTLHAARRLAQDGQLHGAAAAADCAGRVHTCVCVCV